MSFESSSFSLFIKNNQLVFYSCFSFNFNMIIGVIEETTEKNLSDFLERFVHERVEQTVFKKFKAIDEFDALALLNKTKDMHQRILIVELNKEEPEKETAFYEALANWEATTGLTVFKAVYYNDEEGQVIVEETAKEFIEKTYKVKLQEKASEEEGNDEFELPGA